MVLGDRLRERLRLRDLVDLWMGWMCLAREVLGGVLSVFKTLVLKNVIRRCSKRRASSEKMVVKGRKEKLCGWCFPTKR